jgi:hypothetical protein
VLTQNVENIIGGSGTHNKLDYSLYTGTTGVSVSLVRGTATGFLSVTGFRDVTGSSLDDTIIGDSNPNILIGGAGNDTIGGLGIGLSGGTDTLDGGTGINTLWERQDANMTLTDTSLVTNGVTTENLSGFQMATLTGGAHGNTIDASAFTGLRLTSSTPLSLLNNAHGVNLAPNDLTITLTDGSKVNVDLSTAVTVGDVVGAIQAASLRLATSGIDAALTGLSIVDTVAGGGTIAVSSASGIASDLGLNVHGVLGTLTGHGIAGGVTLDGGSETLLTALNNGAGVHTTNGSTLTLSSATQLSKINNGDGVSVVPGKDDFEIVLTDGVTKVDVNLDGSVTLGDVFTKISRCTSRHGGLIAPCGCARRERKNGAKSPTSSSACASPAVARC